MQLTKNRFNEVLGEETSDKNTEYVESVDVDAIKHEQHMVNNVTNVGHYRGVGHFGNREEQMQT
jgi:hypothetical protein